MRRRKKLPKEPGWRWYKSQFSMDNAEWIPAKIWVSTRLGLCFLPWGRASHCEAKPISNSIPSEWGGPITRHKLSNARPKIKITACLDLDKE